MRPRATRGFRVGWLGLSLALGLMTMPAPARAQGVFEVFRRAANAIVGREAGERVIVERQAVLVDGNAAAVAMDPQEDPEVLQWLQQTRPWLRSELHLVRSICQLSDAEYRTISRATLVGLKKQVAELLAAQRKGQNGGNQLYMTDPREMVFKSLVEVVTANLPADRADRYKQEVETRDKEHKSIIIRSLVSILDEELYLTDEQRSKLEAALTEKWDKKWVPSPEHLQYARQYFPKLPESVVGPVLTERQQKAWQGMQKNEGIMFGFSSGMFNDNDGLEPDPADETADAAFARGAALGAVAGWRPTETVIEGRAIRAIRVLPAR